jgi:propanol-preferring alcohol dehydrogenase
MLVPAARLLVPLGDLSPAKAAPLGDAALTPYHAIKRALPQINAESTVVVMGVGGLGHMVIQLLRVLTLVRIIATDVDEKKLNQAKALGADETVNNRNTDEAAERIQKITGPRGTGLVRDCVGVQPIIQSRREASGAQLRLDHRRARWRPPRLSSRQHAFTVAR